MCIRDRDQTACAVGGVITIDFKDPAHPVVGQTAIDLAKHGFVMCISDTKGSHADLTDDYAAIRHEMESVAEQFGKKVLREVDEDEFYKALPKLRKAVGDRAVVRAMHFYNDCRRAAQLCDAVREDDFETFLRLIIEGGHSSFEFNQNAYSIKNPKEQGVPVALALSQRVLNGHGAWRLQDVYKRQEVYRALKLRVVLAGFTSIYHFQQGGEVHFFCRGLVPDVADKRGVEQPFRLHPKIFR